MVRDPSLRVRRVELSEAVGSGRRRRPRIVAWAGEASDVQGVGRMQKKRATRIVVKTIMAVIY